ncbi:hypothetical protein I3760_06G130800 [Carya illinoinensis]|uniref:Uncharacterized protein n=1 Tax=Carya illinoinensis TaxID=32201 RepID=A0A8T1QBA9_CARIL|nr:uncharacterized protein LOC122314258 [Carya illinoinensis]KAG2703266.1 hypothetical protein I3760_06G130800 [Carya illinoinensis]KAG6651655.1 hypothetical protein CIPAW_06G128400 [Carya illinoinensis]KAG6709352.1 hypothetical protein I3842_06G128700 [Carya illinoinensis]
MDIEHVLMDGSISSLTLSSVESDQSGSVLSPEDFAWVDSCLVQDPEISKGSCDFLKDASQEILSSQSRSFSSAAISCFFQEGTDVETPPSLEEADTVHFRGRSDDGIVLQTCAAMDVEDGLIESSNLSGEVFSREDIAWINSCLIEDPEDSVSWASLKNALQEIVSSDFRSFDSSAAVSGGLPKGTDVKILPSPEEAETVQFQGEASDDPVLVNKKTERDSDHLPLKFKNNSLQSLTLKGNPFLPTYTEGMTESESIELKLDLGSSVYGMEPSTEDIFRVWDLGIPSEEDEFDKQLNKEALTESSFKPMPSTLNDLEVSKDFEEVFPDHLVAAMAELSLNQTSS